MKVYRVYTDEGIVDAVVSDNDDDEFWDMVIDNGWNTDRISK